MVFITQPAGPPHYSRWGPRALPFSSPNSLSPTFLHSGHHWRSSLRCVQAVPRKDCFPLPTHRSRGPGRQERCPAFGNEDGFQPCGQRENTCRRQTSKTSSSCLKHSGTSTTSMRCFLTGANVQRLHLAMLPILLDTKSVKRAISKSCANMKSPNWRFSARY